MVNAGIKTHTLSSEGLIAMNAVKNTIVIDHINITLRNKKKDITGAKKTESALSVVLRKREKGKQRVQAVRRIVHSGVPTNV